MEKHKHIVIKILQHGQNIWEPTKEKYRYPAGPIPLIFETDCSNSELKSKVWPKKYAIAITVNAINGALYLARKFTSFSFSIISKLLLVSICNKLFVPFEDDDDDGDDDEVLQNNALQR